MFQGIIYGKKSTESSFSYEVLAKTANLSVDILTKFEIHCKRIIEQLSDTPPSPASLIDWQFFLNNGSCELYVIYWKLDGEEFKINKINALLFSALDLQYVILNPFSLETSPFLPLSSSGEIILTNEDDSPSFSERSSFKRSNVSLKTVFGSREGLVSVLYSLLIQGKPTLTIVPNDNSTFLIEALETLIGILPSFFLMDLAVQTFQLPVLTHSCPAIGLIPSNRLITPVDITKWTILELESLDSAQSKKSDFTIYLANLGLLAQFEEIDTFNASATQYVDFNEKNAIEKLETLAQAFFLASESTRSEFSVEGRLLYQSAELLNKVHMGLGAPYLRQAIESLVRSGNISDLFEASKIEIKMLEELQKEDLINQAIEDSVSTLATFISQGEYTLTLELLDGHYTLAKLIQSDTLMKMTLARRFEILLGSEDYQELETGILDIFEISHQIGDKYAIAYLENVLAVLSLSSSWEEEEKTTIISKLFSKAFSVLSHNSRNLTTFIAGFDKTKEIELAQKAYEELVKLSENDVQEWLDTILKYKKWLINANYFEDQVLIDELSSYILDPRILEEYGSNHQELVIELLEILSTTNSWIVIESLMETAVLVADQYSTQLRANLFEKMVSQLERWDKFSSKILRLRKSLTDLYIQLINFTEADEHLNKIYGLLDETSEIYEDNLKAIITLFSESILKAGSWLLLKSLMDNTINSGERDSSVELFLGEMFKIIDTMSINDLGMRDEDREIIVLHFYLEAMGLIESINKLDDYSKEMEKSIRYARSFEEIDVLLELWKFTWKTYSGTPEKLLDAYLNFASYYAELNEPRKARQMISFALEHFPDTKDKQVIIEKQLFIAENVNSLIVSSNELLILQEEIIKLEEETESSDSGNIIKRYEEGINALVLRDDFPAAKKMLLNAMVYAGKNELVGKVAEYAVMIKDIFSKQTNNYSKIRATTYRNTYLEDLRLNVFQLVNHDRYEEAIKIIAAMVQAEIDLSEKTMNVESKIEDLLSGEQTCWEYNLYFSSEDKGEELFASIITPLFYQLLDLISLHEEKTLPLFQKNWSKVKWNITLKQKEDVSTEIGKLLESIYEAAIAYQNDFQLNYLQIVLKYISQIWMLTLSEKRKIELPSEEVREFFIKMLTEVNENIDETELGSKITKLLTEFENDLLSSESSEVLSLINDRNASLTDILSEYTAEKALKLY
ncbi:MAG: hypothetical protein ACTSYA_04370 [Candidatus Kariarchaeaceae archaeon]